MHPTQTFFDNIASTWDQRCVVMPERIRHILEVARLKDGMNVLDVGTGTGVLIPYIREFIGFEGSITAVDISASMLREAKKKYGLIPNVTFKQTDVETDALEENYDAILLYCVFPHLIKPFDTLKRLTLHLNPGGCIVIGHPESRDDINGIPTHRDVYSNPLIAAEKMCSALRKAALTCDYSEDNEQYYILRIIKSQPIEWH